jgi:hypothetical protein
MQNTIFESSSLVNNFKFLLDLCKMESEKGQKKGGEKIKSKHIDFWLKLR